MGTPVNPEDAVIDARCSEPDCSRSPCARGLCKPHYRLAKKQGVLENYPRIVGFAKGHTCTVESCDRPVRARGYCVMHWQRLVKTGDPGSAAPLRQQHEGITYQNAHDAVRRLWGSPSQYQCVTCPAVAHSWAYDGTDPGQRYGPNNSGTQGWHYYSVWPEFYMPMCRACHTRRDGARARQELHEYRLLKQAVNRSKSES